MGLGAWWLIIGLGALWRRTVWREHGAAIRRVRDARSGTLRATWFGYELVCDGLAVRWIGGVRGAATVVSTSGGRSRTAGWLGPDELDAARR